MGNTSTHSLTKGPTKGVRISFKKSLEEFMNGTGGVKDRVEMTQRILESPYNLRD